MGLPSFSLIISLLFIFQYFGTGDHREENSCKVSEKEENQIKMIYYVTNLRNDLY